MTETFRRAFDDPTLLAEIDDLRRDRTDGSVLLSRHNNARDEKRRDELRGHADCRVSGGDVLSVSPLIENSSLRMRISPLRWDPVGAIF